MKVITQDMFECSAVYCGDLVEGTRKSVILSNWIKIKKLSNNSIKINPKEFALNGFYEDWTKEQKEMVCKALEDGSSPSELTSMLIDSVGIYHSLILVTSHTFTNKNPWAHPYYECSNRMIESLNKKHIINETD
jgi:hypothetical protein